MRTTKVQFDNNEGVELSGSLELPIERKPRFFALFAHCFTCGKDLRSARNLSLALTQEGIAVLRFDFTGLGQSEGDFADTNFSSNTSDLMAAAAYLAEHHEPPALAVGHSLGGTAVLRVSAELKSVKVVASIGAPYQPDHVLNLFDEDLDTIISEGAATVNIGGRPFTIKSQFVKDLRDRNMDQVLQAEDMRGKSVLIMHSPQDQIVEVKNARKIYEAARHPKSFVSLDGADHLLSRKEDATYAGRVIAAWAARYLDDTREQGESEEMLMARISDGPLVTEILAGKHHMLADEPKSVGGENLGPNPYEYVAAGLGACTAMTLRMYADRKKWQLKEVKVHLNYDNKYHDDARNCEEASQRMGKFDRIIEITGELDDQQRSRLLEIANKCPVHKSLDNGVRVETSLRKPESD